MVSYMIHSSLRVFRVSWADLHEPLDLSVSCGIQLLKRILQTLRHDPDIKNRKLPTLNIRNTTTVRSFYYI